MHISDVLRSESADHSNGRFTRIRPTDVIWFSLFFSLGSMVVLYPFSALALLGVIAVLGFCWLFRAYMWSGGLETWQLLVLTPVTGYIVLNYGFANLAIHVAGIPIIVGHGLMFIGLVLAIVSGRRMLIPALTEPSMIAMWGLIAFTSLHLISDIPRYGFYALRDSSMFFEGIFLLLGFLWVTRGSSMVPTMKWLMVAFALNWIYSLSFFWSAELSDWSPKSGIFLTVPLFGNYWTEGFYLTAGGLFSLLVGSHLVKKRRWTMLLLAIAQLFGLAIHQARSMYVGVVLSLIILLLLGETRKCAKLGLMLLSALGLLVLLTSVVGLQLVGRVGPVTSSFLLDHAHSLSGARYTPSIGTIYDREDWYGEVWKRIGSSTTTLLIGDGFGKTLVDFTNTQGVAVRQPHNSHLTVLARLGAVGLALWILFHFFILRRFIYVLRRRAGLEPSLSDFLLWLFIFYVLMMIISTVQPGFEFSHGAIPFYLLTGLALGVVRRQQLDGLVRHRSIGNPLPMACAAPLE